MAPNYNRRYLRALFIYNRSGQYCRPEEENDNDNKEEESETVNTEPEQNFQIKEESNQI